MEKIENVEPVAVKLVTASRMLDCSLTTIYELKKHGQLDVIKIRGDMRITIASIKRLIEQQVTKRDATAAEVTP